MSKRRPVGSGQSPESRFFKVSKTASADRSETGKPGVLKTGNEELDKELEGGILERSVSLIEGSSPEEKSLLCEQLAYSFLQQGHGVAYFTSQESHKVLVTRIQAFGDDVWSYVRGRQLLTYLIQKPRVDEDPDLCDDPERLLVLLGAHIESVAKTSDVILVDSVSELMTPSRNSVIARFLSSCGRVRDYHQKAVVLTMPPVLRVLQMWTKMEEENRHLLVRLPSRLRKNSEVYSGLKAGRR